MRVARRTDLSHRASDPIPASGHRFLTVSEIEALPRRTQKPTGIRKTPDSPPTWATLCRLEPRLLDLENDIRDFGPDRSLSAWYGRFKPRLCDLVGWERGDDGDPILGSSGAYNIAYHHLVKLAATGRRR